MTQTKEEKWICEMLRLGRQFLPLADLNTKFPSCVDQQWCMYSKIIYIYHSLYTVYLDYDK